MAVLVGFITGIGAITGVEPVGRIYLVNDLSYATETIHCTTGPKLDVASLARQVGSRVQIDVLETSNPYVADEVKMV
jgi:hypothetical protein